jgi:hypothetical protein
MMALKLLLRIAQKFDIIQLQIFGDLLLVIQRMCIETTLRNFNLQTLYDEVFNILTSFSYISVSHIYRDRSRLADGLSKARVGLEQGYWIITTSRNGHTSEYNHDPWI